MSLSFQPTDLLSLLIFIPCFNAGNFFGVKAPLNDIAKDKYLTTDFVMDLTFLLARGFDFVLSLGVTTTLITQSLALTELVVFRELVLIC